MPDPSGFTSFSVPCEQRVTSSHHTSPSQQDPTLPESPEVLALRTLCPWVQGSVPFPEVVERPPAHRSGEALAASRARLLNSFPSAPKHISGINPDPVPPRDGLLPPRTGTGSSEPVEAPATGDWSHCLTASLASEASGPSLVPPSCSEERGQARRQRAACLLQAPCLPHLGTACPGCRNQSAVPKAEAARSPEPESTRGPIESS